MTDELTKYCPHCKTIGRFHRNKNRKSGLAGWCANCMRLLQAARWKKRKERALCTYCQAEAQSGKTYCATCAEKASQRQKKYLQNPILHAKRLRALAIWRQTPKGKIWQQEYRFQQMTKPECRARMRESQSQHRRTPEYREYKALQMRKPEYRAWRRIYEAKKKQHDVQYRLACLLRSRLNSALKNNAKVGSAVRDLGCTVAQFRMYLEDLFTTGMSWKNYGNGTDKWNIDHILPLASVDLSHRQEFLRVCHYSNLRPLWQSDNSRRNVHKGYEREGIMSTGALVK